MILALLGYAIGTLQILLLDWIRERVSHGRQLRTLRAYLRQAVSLTKTFDWDENGPTDDFIPRAPSVGPKFVELVSQTHFYLTDEHDDDNSQQALLAIEDGCRVLEYYILKADGLIDRLRQPTDLPERAAIKEALKGVAEYYDDHQPRVIYMIKDAIRDLDRRIEVARIWRQLNRPLGRLPPGANPPELVENDPRLLQGAV